MIVLYDCDEPSKKLAREVIQAILPVVSSLRVVNIEPLYMKAVERLRSLVNKNVDHEADDPLYAEREQILNHPPKGADVSDYLDVLRVSRSPDSDWYTAEDWSEIRNLIYSGHTFTVNPHWNIETQLPFLDWENRQSEARTSSLDVTNLSTIPFPREEYPELIPDEENETQPENLQNYPFLEEAKKYLPSKVADFQNDPYPYERFPERFVDWIAHQAERLETVPQALGTMLLPSIGAHIGNTTLWVDDSYRIKPILWGVNEGVSGTGKTAIALSVSDLYNDAEKKANDEYKASLEAYNEAVANREKPSKSSIAPDQSLVICDATTEAVALRLQSCSPLLLNRDEGDGWAKSFGAYSSGKKDKDSPFWNECYNGNPYKVTRIGRESVYIPQCAVCVATSFQPETFVESLWNEKSKGNGMTYRFLLCHLPKSNIPHKRMPTPDELRIAAQSAFTQLRKNRFDSNIPPVRYRLSDAAAQVHDQFYNVINGLSLRIGGSGSYQPYLPKMLGQAYRIALIFQCVDDLNASEFTQQNDTPKIITPETMEAACDVASWYIREFARITNWADDCQAGDKIRNNMDRAGGDEGRFLQYLQKKWSKHPNGVTRRKVMRDMGLKAEIIVQLAAGLESRNLITITERENPSGKSTIFYKPREI